MNFVRSAEAASWKLVGRDLWVIRSSNEIKKISDGGQSQCNHSLTDKIKSNQQLNESLCLVQPIPTTGDM